MTVLCSVVKHLSSGLEHSRRREKHSITSRVSPYTSLVLQPLLAYFKTEQSTVKASLVANYNYNFSSCQSKTDSDTTIAPKTASCPVIRFFGFCWTQLGMHFFQLFITFIIQTVVLHKQPHMKNSNLPQSFRRGTNILRSGKGVHKITIKSETSLVKCQVAVMHVYVTPKN